MVVEEEDTREVSKFEDLIELAGTDGWKNYLIFIAASMSGISASIPAFSYQFLGATPDYWCYVEELSQLNWTMQQIKDVSIPFVINEQGERIYSSCEMNNFDYSLLLTKSFEEVNMSMSLPGNVYERNHSQPTVKCKSRVFKKDYDTIVTDWDLVCERRYLYSTTQAAVQFGMLIGSMMCGYLIDRFGRLRIFKITVIINIIVGFILAVSPSVLFFLIFRVISSMSGIAFYMSGFVLVTELCGLKQRSLVANYYVIPWTLGIILVSAIAYVVQQWQALQAVMTIPSALLLLTFLILPESPRWLITKGRYEEALTVFQSLAKSNKKKLPSDQCMISWMESIHQSNSTPKSNNTIKKTLHSKLVEFIKHNFTLILEPSLRFRTLITFFCWYSASMVYFGVSLGSSVLSTSDHFYVFLGGLMELPAYFILWPMTVVFGRKKSVITFFLISSLSILAVMGIGILSENSGDYESWKLGLFLSGKLAITAAFHLVWVFTAELYPTTLRSLVIGQGSMMGRVGSICSPYVNDLLGMTTPWAPSALFGIIALIAGVASSVLPETSGKNLPDSLEKVPVNKLKEPQNN